VTEQDYCALYVRASLDATGEELSVTRQDEDGVRYSAARGWPIFRAYVDNDTSAAGKAARPGFEEMIRDYEAGHFRIIVSRDMGRLTRNRADRLHILEMGERRGLVLAFWRGMDLDLSTPAGRLTAEILASVERHEIEAMSDRRKRANEHKAAMGVPPGGKRPFGYCSHGRRTAVCETDGCAGSARSLITGEAQALREAAELVIGGAGLWAATGRLNELGMRTTAGGPWHHSELRRTLLNPRYAGRRVHRGVDVGEGQWPAVFDLDTWAAVRAVLTDPSRSRKGRPRAYLLSALAVCGSCGGKIYGAPRSAGGSIYMCETRRHVAVKTDWVDRRVVAFLSAWLARPDALALLAAPESREWVTALREREQGLIARKNALGDLFGAGVMDQDQVAAASMRIRAELAEVSARLAQVAAVPAFRDLIESSDVEATVRGWGESDWPRFRTVLSRVAVLRLHSPGRGARSLPADAVEFDWRT
jgi:DNA invertase Pin-like site-specific DNA recombinase